jgi:hypothetical protein
MTADPIVAAPDAEAWLWANLRALPGVTSFSYTAQQLDPLGWIIAHYIQVDARAKRRAAARDGAERARRIVLGLGGVPWAEGVICMVGVVEAPFYLPDDDGLPRYAARYEIRAHPRRDRGDPSPPSPGSA